MHAGRHQAAIPTSRRAFLRRLGAAGAWWASATRAAPPLVGAHAGSLPVTAGFTGLVFVGCYTEPSRGGRGSGISVYRVREPGGGWDLVHVARGEVNPSFLAIDQPGRCLYAVHGGGSELVSSHRIDAVSGSLTLLNRQSTGGVNPVHLALDPTGRWLVVANYTGGSVAVLPVEPGGALGPRTDLVTMAGTPGPHRAEQATAHPHHCPFDPSGRYVIVPDKGLDRVNVFRLDATTGKLAATQPGFVATRSGAGPRHAAFHPTLPMAYIVNELDNTVTAYRFEAVTGTLTPAQVITTLPTSYVGNSTGAAILVAPSGRFVLASNRGHDSVVVLAVDPGTGLLGHAGWQSTQGRVPRFVTLAPAGETLLAANQSSDTIVSFRFDPVTGVLTPTGQVVQTGTPSSIVFRQE